MAHLEIKRGNCYYVVDYSPDGRCRSCPLNNGGASKPYCEHWGGIRIIDDQEISIPRMTEMEVLAACCETNQYFSWLS